MIFFTMPKINLNLSKLYFFICDLNFYLGLRDRESFGLDGWADRDFKVPLSDMAYCTICIPLFPTPSTGVGSRFSLQK